MMNWFLLEQYHKIQYWYTVHLLSWYTSGNFRVMGRFVPWTVKSLGRFAPWIVLSLGRFVRGLFFWAVLCLDRFVMGRFMCAFLPPHMALLLALIIWATSRSLPAGSPNSCPQPRNRSSGLQRQLAEAQWLHFWTLYDDSRVYLFPCSPLKPEAAVLDVLWGGNRELTGRNQVVWPQEKVQGVNEKSSQAQ